MANLIKAFASELLDAKNVIGFETGTILIGRKYYQAIRVAFHNGEGEIMKQDYIFDNVFDWSDMIDELLFLTPVWTKDAFVEKHNIQYTPYNKRLSSNKGSFFYFQKVKYLKNGKENNMESNEMLGLYDEYDEYVRAYIENDIEVTEELYKDMSRAKRRKNNFRKAKHKAYLDKHVSWCPMYNNLHQYSKNKIHCSCPACSPKTKRRKNRKEWGPGRYNYKISDQRKVDRMEDEMKGENDAST